MTSIISFFTMMVIDRIDKCVYSDRFIMTEISKKTHLLGTTRARPLKNLLYNISTNLFTIYSHRTSKLRVNK